MGKVKPNTKLLNLVKARAESFRADPPDALHPLEGKVALVSGAGGGIGNACCMELVSQGARAVGLSLTEPKIPNKFDFRICDVTNRAAVKREVEETIRRYKGLDILVCNAGTFLEGQAIEDIEQETWAQSLELNLTSHQQLMGFCIPFLRYGIHPTIIVIGSRNVAAPSKQVATYTVPKAGLTQLARVAALELAHDGIRVNIIHPDAVFDTGLWTKSTLESSAKRYGMTVEQYKAKTLLKTTIKSADVARLTAVMAGPAFYHTTGAQIPIDGGDVRVI